MLAKVSGLFRLTRDAELKYATSGTAVLNLGLACSEKYKDKETQLFIDATAFGKPAEIIQQYAGTKGTQLFITGKLQTESWEKDGKKNYKTVLMIEGFDFVSSSKPQQAVGQQSPVVQETIQSNTYYQTKEMPPQPQEGFDFDGEIPF